MFGISGTELFIIVAFVLLIFGPDKLPQFGRTIGQFMREFKRAQESMEAIIRAEVYASNNKPTPGGTWDIEGDDEDEASAESADTDVDADMTEESAPEPATLPEGMSPFDNVAPEPEPEPAAAAADDDGSVDAPEPASPREEPTSEDEEERE